MEGNISALCKSITDRIGRFFNATRDNLPVCVSFLDILIHGNYDRYLIRANDNFSVTAVVVTLSTDYPRVLIKLLGESINESRDNPMFR